jgi:DNA gyrase/topoisomerase IV subunit B
MGFFDFLTEEIAIDLGTANTLIIHNDKVVIDSPTEADRVFSMLMGDEVPPRREFIEKNAKYANIDI